MVHCKRYQVSVIAHGTQPDAEHETSHGGYQCTHHMYTLQVQICYVHMIQVQRIEYTRHKYSTSHTHSASLRPDCEPPVLCRESENRGRAGRAATGSGGEGAGCIGTPAGTGCRRRPRLIPTSLWHPLHLPASCHL